MIILEIMFYTFQIVWGAFLLLPVLNNTFASLIKKDQKQTMIPNEFDYGIIITVYKNLQQAIPLVESLLNQSYNKSKVYLVADRCEDSGLEFESDKVKILFPKIPLNSKVKSIEYAVKNFDRPHDNLIIFDADNLAHPHFVKEINNYFQKGFLAVQGLRSAKNLNSSYSGLDALGEMFYNRIDRYSLYKLGASSTLAGSGMAFNVELYLKLMKGKIVLGGFDKILQGELVNNNYRIAFAKKAITFDEKVSNGTELKQQRTRWLHAYFKYVHYGITSFFAGIKGLNFNKFYFGLNHMRPPLFILGSLSFLSMISNLFVFPLGVLIWMLLGLLFVFNIFWVMKLENADKKLWSSLKMIPKFFVSQFKSLLNFKTASKKFIVTNHSQNLSINDVMKEIVK